MTLDEKIKCEEEAVRIWETAGDCICAFRKQQEEHHQLANWIKELKDLRERLPSAHKESASDIPMIIKDFKELPAAQPKIIFCKDCKHYVEYHKLCKGMGQYTCHMNPDDFCSHGERKE